MNTADIQIRKAVSVVLLRACVDFNRIQVHVARGCVQLGGFFTPMQRQLKLIHDHADYVTETQTLLRVIPNEVRRISGVASVRMAFQNWKKIPGLGWVEQKVK